MLLGRMSKADFVAMSKSRSHESDLGNRSEHSLLSDSQTEVRLDPGQWRSVLQLSTVQGLLGPLVHFANANSDIFSFVSTILRLRELSTSFSEMQMFAKNVGEVSVPANKG